MQRTRELEWTGRARAGGGVGVGSAAGRRGWVGGVGGDGEGTSTPAAAARAVRLLEGFGEGGVEGHVRLVVGEVAELHQEAVLWVELAVAWDQHRRKHWGENTKTRMNNPSSSWSQPTAGVKTTAATNNYLYFYDLSIDH